MNKPRKGTVLTYQTTNLNREMKHLLINQQTGEETLCDKITIDGFDYYVNGEVPPSIGDKSVLEVEGFDPIVLTHFEECQIDYEGKKVIATNNPNISIPKVVDDLDIMKETLVETYLEKIKDLTKRFFWKAGFKHGYNKSQETHPFSEEDMIEFAKWLDDNMQQREYYPMSSMNHKELFQLWKSQQPKKVYYNLLFKTK